MINTQTFKNKTILCHRCGEAEITFNEITPQTEMANCLTPIFQLKK